MAIHHDKTAYGKLASAREELSEERVQEMLRLLSETAAELECAETATPAVKGERAERTKEKSGESADKQPPAAL